MSELRWIRFPHKSLVVNGLAWFGENDGEIWRLPKRMKDVVRDEVWELALCPSGGRIRFKSDTTALSMRLEYGDLGDSRNICKIGRLGFDVYADGAYWKPIWPDGPGKCELSLFAGAPKKSRELTIHMPPYFSPKILAVGLDKGAKISAPAPFALEKPVVYYGTSVTQGGCASHPGNIYQAMLGRITNTDYVVLGFSGNGLGEPEMARAVAEVDAACYVCDFAQNNPTAESLRENYGPFLATIRAAHPETPIVCITPIYSNHEAHTDHWRAINPAYRQVIRDAVAARISSGDKRIILVEGEMLISQKDTDAFVDGIHPNDIGFKYMAERLAPALRTALAL